MKKQTLKSLRCKEKDLSEEIKELKKKINKIAEKLSYSKINLAERKAMLEVVSNEIDERLKIK